jgi:hypothetical protein
VCTAAVMLIAGASPSAASVTIGQLAPGTPTGFADPSGTLDILQPTVTSGNTFVAPGNGTITSWSHNAAAGAGQMMTFKIFRPVSGTTYTVIGHDGPRPLTGGAVNTFPANVGVKPGDVIGLSFSVVPPAKAWSFAVPGDAFLRHSGSLADFQSGAFDPNPDFRVNVTAVFDPTNAFELRGINLHRKKGTADLKLRLPNPGELALSGNGLKGVTRAVTVTSPHIVRLPMISTGKKRAKLNQTSRVRVKAKVTYTPTGGDPSTQSRKLKLKKL